jgi:hypothetical protein
MKRSEIYREAAEIVSQRRPFLEYACHALRRLGLPCDEFESYMWPPDRTPDQNRWSGFWGAPDAESQDCRVIALCFMAAIAEDEERSTGKTRSAGKKSGATRK